MSKIEWTNETWNPIIGCSKVSEGCNNCYAERMAGRLSNIPQTHQDYKEIVKWGVSKKTDNYYGKQEWNGQTHLIVSALDKPYHWKKPRKIFVGSMGDIFYSAVPFEWIDQVIDVIRDNPHHIFMFLTKRPANMKVYFEELYGKGKLFSPELILPNLWLGVTAENQQYANYRIPILLEIPAVKRFVSIEPMLGFVDLTKLTGKSGWLYQVLEPITNCGDSNRPALDWVIVGGETGPKARPMHPDWPRLVLKHCKQANVPFFFKSWGAFQEGSDYQNIKSQNHIVMNNGDHARWDNDDWKPVVRMYTDWNTMNATVMARVGKKQSGNKIDEVFYQEFPALDIPNP